jgi:hypothetical protein
MNRLSGLIIIFLLVAAVGALFWHVKEAETKFDPIEQHIPNEVDILVKSFDVNKSLNDLTSNNLIFSDLLLLPDTNVTIKFLTETLADIKLRKPEGVLGFNQKENKWFLLLAVENAKNIPGEHYPYGSTQKQNFILNSLNDTLFLHYNAGVLTISNQKALSTEYHAQTIFLEKELGKVLNVNNLKVLAKRDWLNAPNKYFRFNGKDTTWAEMEVNFSSNNVSISGLQDFITAPKFEGQNGGVNQFLDYLPIQTEAVFASFLSEPHKYIVAQNQDKENSNKINEAFNYWLGNEWALVFQQEVSLPPILMLECINPERALSQLDSLISEPISFGNEGDSIPQSVLFELRSASFITDALGYPFNNYEFNWAVFINEYLVFAHDKLSAALFAYKVNQGMLLANTENFKAFKTRIKNENQLFVFGNFNALSNPDFIENPFQNPLFNDSAEKTKNLRFTSAQFNLLGSRLFFDVNITHTSQLVENSVAMWKQEFKPLQSKAHWVLNHATGRGEILLQDTAHNIYLVAANGKEVWNAKIDGPIISPVTQIDAYKNNKLQMLFTTNKSIYLIDRIGRTVANFPISVEPNAFNPLVVDYDFSKEYRIMIPFKKQLLNFDALGKSIPGFSSGFLNQNFLQSPQYFRIKNRDYLLAFTENGSAHILNRRGVSRANTNLVVPKNLLLEVLVEPSADALDESLVYYVDSKMHFIKDNLVNSKPDTILALDRYEKFSWLKGKSPLLVAKAENRISIFNVQGKVWLSASVIGDVSQLCVSQVFSKTKGRFILINDLTGIKIFDELGNLIETIESEGGKYVTAFADEANNELQIVQVFDNKVAFFSKTI